MIMHQGSVVSSLPGTELGFLTMTNNPLHLFVYGSLLTGFWNHRPFAPWLIAHQPGTITGFSMVHLPEGYPAALRSSTKTTQIVGELHTYRSGEDVLRALDEMEDYCPDDPNGSMYIRRRVSVELDDQQQSEAWCYLYNSPSPAPLLRRGAIMVTSGDWRAFMDPQG